MSWLMFHLLIFDLLYNKYFILHLISLDGEAVLAYCSIFGPESNFYLLVFFIIHLLKITIDVFIYLYWFIFTKYFVHVLCQSNWNWYIYLFLILFTIEGIISMFHVKTSDSHIFSRFTCKFSFEYVLILFFLSL